MTETSRTGTPRRPLLAARRTAAGVVAAAVLIALGVLAAAAVQQARKVVDIGVLAAPTPPSPVAPLTTPVELAARPQPAVPRMPQASGGVADALQPGAQRIPVPGAAPPDAGPPFSTLQGPPPKPSPPRPTPTPEIIASLRCRKGLYFDIEPSNTLVTVNGEPVGEVGQWDEKDHALELRRPGVYYVRLSCSGCRTLWFKVTVDPNAEDSVVKIKRSLED